MQSSKDLAAILGDLLRENGSDLIDNRVQLQGLLRGLAPDRPREVHLLLTAIDAGVPARLLAKDGPASESEVSQEAAHMVDDFGSDALHARQAVETWVTALGASKAPSPATAQAGPDENRDKWASPTDATHASRPEVIDPSSIPAPPPAETVSTVPSRDPDMAPAEALAPIPATLPIPAAPPLPALLHVPVLLPIPTVMPLPGIPAPPAMAPLPAALPLPAAVQPLPLPLPTAVSAPPDALSEPPAALQPLPLPTGAAAIPPLPLPLPLPGAAPTGRPQPLPGSPASALQAAVEQTQPVVKPLPGSTGRPDLKPLPRAGSVSSRTANKRPGPALMIALSVMAALGAGGLWAGGYLAPLFPGSGTPAGDEPAGDPPSTPGGQTEDGYPIADVTNPPVFTASRLDGDPNTLLFTFGLRFGSQSTTYQAAVAFQGTKDTGVGLIKAFKDGRESSTGQVQVTRAPQSNGYVGFNITGVLKGAVDTPSVCVTTMAGKSMASLDIKGGGGFFCAFNTTDAGICAGDKQFGCGTFE